MKLPNSINSIAFPQAFTTPPLLLKSGRGQDQQHKLTSLKIDKCNKLVYLNFSYPPASNITIGEDKQLITDRNMFKSQVEKLISVIRNIKGLNLGDPNGSSYCRQTQEQCAHKYFGNSKMGWLVREINPELEVL
ncbi:15521_t:CDS:2, partial [Gigaspora margarita]